MTKTCVVCGAEFETHQSRRIYCSDKCKRASYRAMWREYYYRVRAGQEVHKKGEPRKDREAPLKQTLAELQETGETYAERQKKQTVEMFARVKI